MKKKVKVTFILFALLIILGFAVYLFINNLIGYAIVFMALAFILFLLLCSVILQKNDRVSIYKRELKQILKKYDAILVETSTIPDIEDKNIMLITNIEDMIDASVEIRKPIYYKKESNYCTFMLLDNQDICIYILKCYKDKKTIIEMFINERKDNIEGLIDIARKTKKGNKRRSINIKDEIDDDIEEL